VKIKPISEIKFRFPGNNL